MMTNTAVGSLSSLRSPVAKSILTSPVISAFTSADGATNVVKLSSGLLEQVQRTMLNSFGLASSEDSITRNRSFESCVKKVNARPTMQQCMACTP